MKIVQQRLALLTGVSVSVLGLAAPAQAATSPGISHVDTTDPVSDTLTICAIGDDCTFGVESTGTGLVTATVNNPSNGQIFQQGISLGANAVLDMTNGGNAQIAASASATAAGSATAIAAISQGILQSAVGATGAAANFANSGTIALNAIAFASANGTTAQGAFAGAGVVGINLFASATGAGDAAIDVDNQGSIAVGATAHALSAGPAVAQATAIYGIGANAHAADGDASVNVGNGGDLTVVASAQATGVHAATAFAAGVGGIVAVASGSGVGDATAAVANDGSLLVEADAAASATTNAQAVAIAVTGVYDIAHAATGDAHASVDNSGTIDVVANATATALVAQATAVAGGALFAGGVFQSAAAADGSAHGVLSNGGDISIAANANANGSVIAYANALGGPGVNQLVFAANGNAVGDMTNSGSIAISADAEALATNSAYAAAILSNAFNNAAFATSGDALLSIDNSGTVAVNVTAHAAADNLVGAHATGTHLVGQVGFAFSGDAAATFDNSGSISEVVKASAAGGTAFASATLGQAVYQSAFAFGGDASAALNNEGVIALGVSAAASATGAGAAFGLFQGGIVQQVSGDNGLASITNSGTIDMHAVADAKGNGGFTFVTFSSVVYTVPIAATATAVLTAGIFQNAFGVTNAAASLTNTGSISLGATAHASGAGFTTTIGGFTTAAGPQAFALLGGGVVQLGFSPFGDAALSLDNEGTISIGANAGATSTGVGPALARAWAEDAVIQQANASTGLASAEITNAGTLTIGAVADALATNGGQAFASAQLLGGVGQRAASAGTAAAELDNTGSVAMLAQAHALASDGHAQAVAGVTAAMIQFVQGQTLVSGTGKTATTFVGDAQATLNNAGSIQIAAVGIATGTGASGNGNIGTGIAQLGFAAGNVDLALANGGLISVSAGGSAHASQGTAFAGAGITVGVGQRAIAGGSAVAAVSNAGTLAIVADANAVAQAVDGDAAGAATAVARLGAVTFIGVHAAIDQQAIGSAASLGLTNSGSITLGAAASATGSSAMVDANVISGIRQQARSSGGEASANLDNSGTLVMAATGIAHATGGTAHAIATIGGAIDQNVFAISGDAFASFDNSGTLDLSAFAHASGSGDAFALAIANGVGQDVNVFATGTGASAAAASALFTNSGEFDVTAIAKATGGTQTAATKSGGIDSASAFASADAFGAAQFAQNAVMANSGTMSVTAGAMARGDILVNAHANGRLSFQQAMNFAGGDASASFTNDGDASLLVVASAQATSGNAFATASVSAGLAQMVLASGNASASLTNSGSLTIGELATAVASSGQAVAQALVNGGVVQNAAGASAEATIANAGAITISDAAVASAQGGTASAVAFISNAVGQTAFAQSGPALAGIDNSGTISVGVVASADGNDGPAAALGVVVDGIRQSAHGLGGEASVSLVNDGSIDLAAVAHAQGGAGTATFVSGSMTFTYLRGASATAFIGSGIYQSATGIGASVALTNSGEINIAAIAAASGAIGAATAQIQYAISQYAFSTSGDASIEFTNSGAINETAAASAHGTANFGLAAAILTSAAFQLASGADHATVDFDNSGTVDAHVIAVADGATGAIAGAFIGAGIEQFAIASGTAKASMTNSGSIVLDAAAVAHGGAGFATGLAFVSHAISQHAYGNPAANVSLTNSGDIVIAASASATGETRLVGEGGVFQGIYQSASATGAATASFVNSGTVEISAKGYADGGIGRAIAIVAPAVFQGAWGSATRVTLDNSGTIDVSAIAQGTGTIGAPVQAHAFGIIQEANAGTAELFNSGEINLTAAGLAITTGNSAFVGVGAVGVVQHGGLERFDNSGTLSVKAVAHASGAGGFVGGSATGYVATGSGQTLDVSNSGKLIVTVDGVAPQGVNVAAVGMSVEAQGTYVSTSSIPVQQALVDGTITNSGQIDVAAHAAGGGTYTTVVGTGTAATTITIQQSFAQATGIRMDSGVNAATVTNSGTIDVEAVTADNGITAAYGVRVTGNGSGLPADADQVFTFTNDGGTIIARQSVDGGDTWQRGMAIDVSQAPNASVINLLGDGVIYGNIAVQAGDVINVEDGTTYFDGIINPSFVPAGGVTAATLDSGLAGVGTLNIDNGGNLELVSHAAVASMDNGPSYAFVDTLNIGADGTITYDLPAVTGTAPVGSYPQVFADTANLDGTLVANIQPANGLFETSFYDNVIDANVRNGTFDVCALAAPYTNSLLLDLKCEYDGKANVDLALTRIAFGDVAGLNGNGIAVGGGLECIYDVGLTGPVADMFADLFLFTDAANYNVALNQLSGSVYANYLNSFASLGVHYDDLTDHATDCEVPAVAGSVLECRTGSPIHVWGQLDYQTRKADGDVEAGSTRSKRFTGLFGLDAKVGNAAIVGVDAGYVSNHVRDHQFGDTAKGEGWQVGGYAVYDPGKFFLKGVTTYSSLNGHSNRTVDWNGLAAGVNFAGRLTGSPDVHMWTAGLHGGARLSMSQSSVITPYLNYDYVHAKLDGFTETGLPGANLTVEGGRSNHSFVTGGAKWATQMGGVVPEVNLGYRYRFGDQRSDFRAFFNGDNDCDFAIESAAQKRGTFLAGLSVGGKVGPVDLRIGYEGEFNGDVTSHSGNFKLVLPLGGHAAPPPPVAAPAPPPPPPAVEQPAPPPPPPPPAPVERGERGQ